MESGRACAMAYDFGYGMHMHDLWRCRIQCACVWLVSASIMFAYYSCGLLCEVCTVLLYCSLCSYVLCVPPVSQYAVVVL
jgi:hypothetical protein